MDKIDNKDDYDGRTLQKDDIELYKNITQCYLPRLALHQFDTTTSPLPQLGGNNQRITVMFFDICKFSQVIDGHTPQQMTGLVNEYLQVVLPHVLEQGGCLDKIMCDGFMAFFTESLYPDHANRAVITANNIHLALQNWSNMYNETYMIRIGVDTGEAMVGNIGISKAMNFTAIGDVVNKAQRIEQSCNPNQILISSDSYYSLNKDSLHAIGITFTHLPDRLLKGHRSKVGVYEVTRL